MTLLEWLNIVWYPNAQAQNKNKNMWGLENRVMIRRRVEGERSVLGAPANTPFIWIHFYMRSGGYTRSWWEKKHGYSGTWKRLYRALCEHIDTHTHLLIVWQVQRNIKSHLHSDIVTLLTNDDRSFFLLFPTCILPWRILPNMGFSTNNESVSIPRRQSHKSHWSPTLT